MKQEIVKIKTGLAGGERGEKGKLRLRVRGKRKVTEKNVSCVSCGRRE